MAIENEENSVLYWGGTADDYVRLVKTASASVRSADPKTKITDGGTVSSVWGTVIAKDWINSGTRSRSDALNWAYGFFTADQPSGSSDPRLSTPTQIGQFIDSPASSLNTTTWPFVNSVFDGIAGSIDFINFHFYQSPRYLPDVANWLRGRTKLPVLTNEMSSRVAADQCNPAAPFAAATLDRMAQMVFEYLVTARGADIGPVVWFSIDTVCDPSRIADQYNASLFNTARQLPPPRRPHVSARRRNARNIAGHAGQRGSGVVRLPLRAGAVRGLDDRIDAESHDRRRVSHDDRLRR